MSEKKEVGEKEIIAMTLTEIIEAVDCPFCKVECGSKCVNKETGTKVLTHMPRVKAALKQKREEK